MIPRAGSGAQGTASGRISVWWAWTCERARMRLSAVLMDAGAYLALDPIEHRARRLRRGVLGRKGRRLGPHAALLAMGAEELAGEATLVLGRRAAAGGRILSLLCVAVGEERDAPEAARTHPGVFGGTPPEKLARPEFYWAVRTQAADAKPGFAGARTSMLQEREGALETALVAFFSEPVPRALAGLDRSETHLPAGEGTGRVPKDGEAPAA